MKIWVTYEERDYIVNWMGNNGQTLVSEYPHDGHKVQLTFEKKVPIKTEEQSRIMGEETK